MTQSHPSRRSRIAVAGTAGVLALAGSVVTAFPAAAGGNGCENRNNNTVAKLTDCVTLEGVMEHLDEFQAIADANGGTRASGTPGYTASAQYVEDRLEAAGWTVERQAFEFPYFQQTSSAFARVAPTATTYVEGTDYAVATYSGSGDVTATVQAVDVTIPPVGTANGNTSGCEDADFAGFTPGNIALLQRGTCTFGEKAENAREAGAVGVVLFNEGQPGRDTLLSPTLGAPLENAIPVVGVSYATGTELAQAGTSVRIQVDAVSGIRETENVIAELSGRTSDNVVMAGAHLDSVPEGPGINDNGSGSAGLIEVAENLAKVKPTNTIRFAWWGAEELGLLGSAEYVDSLSEDQVADIGLYLNFDMIGSPNFARFIYDGDQSTFPAPDGVNVPEGSDQIEYVFEDFYESRGLYYEGTEFSGRSDYQAFINANIPSGGLFTGAEVEKQEYQVPLYGGEAGVAYDPNYHQAGDDITNLDPKALDENSDAVAYAVLTLAYDSSRVNDVAGRPVPGGTYEGDPNARQYRVEAEQEAGGGGLHAGHDHGGVEV
ncbi:aminopeptidase PaaP [Geodermatophilus aquaeductus]|uniref:Zn-dependent amino-or carboxypeptidase, M28 family n=1 Tax=Geodermatophilus aquaeductus TaxID=1564161 RepID=A0A521CMF3_9ACTN|nr:M28 family metallopeptidase [Geodermatophilus aquaeductus]SMO60627.1 Zn-dependent amino-or carboxypeptidase, M28 family [Geodermatophilus aquaeductus]